MSTQMRLPAWLDRFDPNEGHVIRTPPGSGYGYWVGGTYGMEISDDGSYLVICMNGGFVTRDDENGSPYGNPSLFVVHIPEEER